MGTRERPSGPGGGFEREAGARRAFRGTLVLLVSLLVVAVRADAQPTCDSTMAIACGDSVAGSLASIGESDCYTFTAAQGEAVGITTQETAGIFQACWTLFTPAGVSMGQTCGHDERTLPDTGTYTIQVADAGDDETGAYSLGFVVLSATASTCASPIGCGETVAGDLAGVGRSDTYTFSALTGDTVSLTTTQTGGALVACWELYDPSGLSLGTRCGQDERTLASDGDYTVRVYDDDESQSGTYDLNLVVVSETGSSCADTITCGETRTGTIAAVGKSDTYRFAAAAGETISVVAKETAGGLRACWALYDPQGAWIASACGQGERSLAIAGDYTIRVHDLGDTETGSYAVNVVVVSATPSQCGVPIACGDTLAGALAFKGESDTFVFSAASGEVVSLTAQETGGTLSACWELYDPSGTSLGRRCGQEELTLPSAGTYTIRVDDGGNNDTGTYHLNLVVVSATAGNCGEAIACTQPLTRTIGLVGENDTFAFLATAGEPFPIATEATAGTIRACWELYDPSGTSLGGLCGQDVRTPAFDGIYTLRVYDDFHDGTGSYQVVVCVPPTTTTTSTSTSTSSSTTLLSGSSTTTTTTLMAAGRDLLLDGKKLVLKIDPITPDRNRIKMVSKDVRIGLGSGPGTIDDPTMEGGSLRIVTPAGDAFDDTYELPPLGWEPVKRGKPERGWKYVVDGPVERVVVRPGKKLKILARGPVLGHTLGADPDPVSVVLTIGSQRYCLAFGGETTFVSDRRYKALNAHAPSSCPADASATGAFVR